MEGNYAYLAAGPGLRVFDISRPEKPVDVGAYKTVVSGFEVANDKIYFSTYDALGGMDLHQPRSFFEIGIKEWKGKVSIKDFAIVGSLIYAVAHPINPNLNDTKFFIVDISNIKAPKVLAEYDNLPTSFSPEIQVNNTTAYVNVADGIHILDVSNPRQPLELDAFQTSDRIYQMVVSEDHLYAEVACDCSDCLCSDCLSVFDITNPGQIRELYHCQDIDINDFDIESGYGYFLSDDELKVFDVSTEEKPIEVSSYSLQDSGSISAIEVTDGKLYLSLQMGGLAIVDAQSLIPENKLLPN